MGQFRLGTIPEIAEERINDHEDSCYSFRADSHHGGKAVGALGITLAAHSRYNGHVESHSH